MPSDKSSDLRLLRLFLGFAAVAWGASVVGVFTSWSSAARILKGFGAHPIAYDPMLDYWLRMAAGAFAFVGVLYLVLMISPQKHFAVIPWFGALMVVEGLVLLIHGLRLGLAPLPFYADTTACLVGGAGIVFFSQQAGGQSDCFHRLAVVQREHFDAGLFSEFAQNRLRINLVLRGVDHHCFLLSTAPTGEQHRCQQPSRPARPGINSQ